MHKVEILGVQINNISLQETADSVSKFLKSKDKHYIVTPNPEFLVSAQKDKNFKQILNYADIAVADGVGLIKAAKFLGKKLHRVTGVDLMGQMCEIAESKNKSIYLLGATKVTVKKTVEALLESFSGLKIAGYQSGGEIDQNGKSQNDSRLIEEINKAKPEIIFIAFGQVKQEKWIFNNLDKLKSVKVAIGVGGAFDYIAGILPRAPKKMRELGLEWLYRLVKQPERLPRIINALVVFSYLVLKEKFYDKK